MAVVNAAAAMYTGLSLLVTVLSFFPELKS